MDILNSLCVKDGISAAGVCDFSQLTPLMMPDARVRAMHLVPGAASIFVVLLPYFAEDSPGNLSLYARGRDYHAVLDELLAPFAAELIRERGCRAVPLVDASPLPEVQAARLSGVGKVGQNGLIFDADYGSYVFIGTILTDLPFAPLPAVRRHRPPAAPAQNALLLDCVHCGACVRRCPQGAILPGGRMDERRCLSALTQQSGTLSGEAAAAVSAHPLIWGCDLCQQVCPQNRGIRQAMHPAFSENLLHSLSLAELDGLTRRAFLQKYPQRAFTWRGPAPLLRNLKLKKEHP